MAGKRRATSDLNHTNWDDEEESEDVGEFSKAAEDVIKNRVIKVAKRRNPISSTTTPEEGKGTTFTNFGGFAKSSTSTTPSAFSFLSNLKGKTEEQPKSNGIDDTSTNTPSKIDKFAEKSVENTEHSKDYLAKIKGLNQSVSKWIQKHVDVNPFLNLTPIFRDYEKYLEDIESLKTHGDSHKIKNVTCTIIKPAEGSTTLKSTFAFGKPHEQSQSSLNLVNSNLEQSEDTSGFKFGSSSTKRFTFTGVPEKIVDEEDEDEPPKVEFTPVMEDGHIYSVRCKVFVKQYDTFGDRGVGNLFLKPVPDSDKIQLIVRADTNLGNLTCNFILSKSIPIQRLGQKDVMLVCLPTPEHKPPPVPVLFRVKSSEEADALLKTLEKHKK
ncbi:hypothetical protein FQA39_LY00558 [Lamprigera yunnana]|nr:hypothetical protein FQA39_LY00558 [Lamprigera yunnana]